MVLELGKTRRPKRTMLEQKKQQLVSRASGLEHLETRLPMRTMLELALERSSSMVAMSQQRVWWSSWWLA